MATCSGAFWQHFSHFWPSSCEYVFWIPSGVYKTQVTDPKKRRNGIKNGSQNARFGGLPNVSWIYYLLYLDHISVPRMGRKRPPKSKHASEVLRQCIFNDLGRICGSIWEPIWHHFGSLWGVRFLSRFWNGFCVDDLGTAVPPWWRIGGKGASPLAQS